MARKCSNCGMKLIKNADVCIGCDTVNFTDKRVNILKSRNEKYMEALSSYKRYNYLAVILLFLFPPVGILLIVTKRKPREEMFRDE